MWITQDKLNRVVIPWLILPLISCLIFFCCRSVTYFSWLKSKQKVPALAKTVILRFAHKSQATFLGHAKFASNNFSFKHRGQKNSLFTHKQQHTMHRSNSICPISAVWTVVCCVFDSAGVFGITSAVHYTIKTIQIYIVLFKSYLDASCVFIINPSVELNCTPKVLCLTFGVQFKHGG